MGIELMVKDTCNISIQVVDKAGCIWIYRSLCDRLRRFATSSTLAGEKPMTVRKEQGKRVVYYGPKALANEVLKGYTGRYEITRLN